MKQMNKLRIAILLGILLISILMFASCSSDQTPYDKNDRDGYCVSVKYDANGGSFTTNTEVITDSYNLNDLVVGQDGKKELILISPDNEIRGAGNAFSATRSGYVLAGWYSERIPVTDADGNQLDEDGKLVSETGKDPAYTYGGLWNFSSDRYKIDDNDDYSSKEPQLTLYAGWVPEFTYEFYSKTTNELLGTYVINPLDPQELILPQWDENSGKLNMNNVPKVSGKTYENIYLNSDDTQAVKASSIQHHGTLNLENGTVDGKVMKLYIDLIEGDWFRIYTAEQLAKNAGLSSCYEICADLDFSDVLWPTVFMYGNYTGTIHGNGYTVSNVTVEQDNASRPYAGLFGQLETGASIKDLTFNKVTMTVSRGTRTEGARFGLLAGTISSNADLSGIQILDSVLKISSGSMFPNDYSIGLVCGLGYRESIDLTGIKCEAVNEESSFQTVSVETDGNIVTVIFDSKT